MHIFRIMELVMQHLKALLRQIITIKLPGNIIKRLNQLWALV